LLGKFDIGFFVAGWAGVGPAPGNQDESQPNVPEPCGAAGGRFGVDIMVFA